MRKGEIGRIRHIEAVFNANLPDTPGELRYIEALGGGALMDLGCYCMHWIRTVAGDEPTVVKASARCATPGVDLDIEARARLHQRPDGDAQVLDAARRRRSLAAPARAWRIGRARARQSGIAACRRHVVDRVGECHPCRSCVSGGDTTFHYQLQHVIEVIKGRAQPLTGGDDAIGNMRAIDAIYRAAGLKPRGLSG